MKTVTFYHSVVCPRCRLTSLFLASLLPGYPDVRIEKVAYLGNLTSARAAGVRSIPTLVAGDQLLSGFLLSKGRLRRFLDSVVEPR